MGPWVEPRREMTPLTTRTYLKMAKLAEHHYITQLNGYLTDISLPTITLVQLEQIRGAVLQLDHQYHSRSRTRRMDECRQQFIVAYGIVRAGLVAHRATG